jgi:hypothetical protein
MKRFLKPECARIKYRYRDVNLLQAQDEVQTPASNATRAPNIQPAL